MTKHKKTSDNGWFAGLIVVALAGIALVIGILLRGTNVALFSPKGFIAGEQYRLIVFSMILMLMFAIPTLSLFYFFVWRYRESNHKAAQEPQPRARKYLALGFWMFPAIIVLILASVMWPATHSLEPNKSIASDAKPLTVQVVALRWKWLFIYPEQNIATVNFVQIPTDTPVRFELTADEAPMSSFWVPQLGGQLYAMTGHTNPLNLIADTPGEYAGSSAEINGPGFSGMRFTAKASSQQDFDRWVQGVQKHSDVLGSSGYDRLLMPSENNAATSYALIEEGLFDKILRKYTGSHPDNTEHQ